jgi:threonine/homoserine/homoserine lactone efflux protein
VLGSIAAVCLVVAAGPSPNLLIFTRTWAKLSRRFGVLTTLGVATVLGLSLVFEWFV